MTWTCCCTAGCASCLRDIRAPSTFRTFLRSFTFGHVRQLDGVAASFLTRLAGATPLLHGADMLALVDLDDTVRQSHGYAKQGAGLGLLRCERADAPLATVLTPLGTPLTCGIRLRKDSANSPRGAGRFVAHAVITAKAAGAG